MNSPDQPVVRKVLVVDDEPAICHLVADVLDSEGYKPVTCNHPTEAIAAAERELFHLAIVDIRLPGMDGLDLAAELRERIPQLQIIVMTGHGTLDAAVRAIKLGAYDFLRKPFSVTELRLCLRRFGEREALKERIELADRRYFHLVQNIPLLIILLRSDFQLEFVNEACLPMLGYEPEEALEQSDWLLNRIYPEDRNNVRDLFDSAFSADGSPISVECRFVHKNGRLIHVIMKFIPWIDSGKEQQVKHLEGIVVDITNRVFLEKALIQREKLRTLGAISAEVAHEIRNPLVSLGGFARRLQKKHPELPEIRIILDECIRLEKILDRIKNYLRPVEIHPREFSVNLVLQESLDLLAPEMEGKLLQRTFDMDPKLPDAYVDPDILGEVFINIIRSAETTLDKGGMLNVRTFESEQNLYVEFKNEVKGVKIRDPETLFLPFEEGGGNIGLSLSYRLLKNMGGVLSLTVDDDHMNFTISLPKMARSTSHEFFSGTWP